MGKSVRFSMAALLAAGLITLAVGCGNGDGNGEKKDGDKKESKESGASGENGGKATPEATFAAAQEAEKNGDWTAFVACLTPAGIDDATMMMTMVASFTDSEEVKSALAKHGVTEEWVKKVDADDTLQGPEQVMKKMAEPVKDKRAYVADVFSAMQKTKDSGFSGPDLANSTLTDVKIDGDKATATREFEKNGTKHSETMTFEKVDGKWLMNVPKPGGGPGGPPPGGDVPIDFPTGPSAGDQPPGDTPSEDAPGDGS